MTFIIIIIAFAAGFAAGFFAFAALVARAQIANEPPYKIITHEDIEREFKNAMKCLDEVEKAINFTPSDAGGYNADAISAAWKEAEEKP